MSFFGPISPPVLDESSTPLIRRAFHRAKVVGSFAIVQAVVQCIGFMSGILLVRSLDQHQYAYFTITNTMQGTVNLLADIGVSVGLVSIGGRVWQDRYRFGQLINTALGLRKKLGAIAIVVVAPILFSMLIKNGASIPYAMLLIALVLVGITIELSIGVFGVVPRLRSDISCIQRIDLTGAITRLCLLVGLIFVFLNAGVAVGVASATLILQYALLRNYAATVVDLNAPENAEDRQAIVKLIKHLAANAVFYCLQGQITIFLISFFAHRTSAVAEVGALGRLAMIFAVLSNLLTNVFAPAFARCHDSRKLRWLYAGIIGAMVCFSLLVIAAAALFPNEFLFILGNKYSHLHRELLLMVGGAVLSVLTGTFWALNASKAWVAGAWLYIPITLATQVALIPFTDFSSVSGVLTFNIFSAIPNLLLNIVLSYRGFRSFQAANA